jgi:hypothetical protein
MAIATGCTTFKSVKATALLGKNLNEHTKELGSISQICSITEKLKVGYLTCSEESKQQIQYQRAAKVISAYGAKLEELVGQQEDLDYATELGSIVKGFSTVEWNKLSTDATMQGTLLVPLQGVAKLIVDGEVNSELNKIIIKADPLFQRLKKDVKLEFDNRTASLGNANLEINQKIRVDRRACSHTIANQEAPECEDACDIKLILGCRDFRAMNKGWDDYTKALYAFIDAHHELKEGYSADKVFKDPETYKKLLTAVKAVYDATQ